MGRRKPPPPPPPKGTIGGRARMAKQTPEERKQLASIAAKSRWARARLKATAPAAAERLCLVKAAINMLDRAVTEGRQDLAVLLSEYRAEEASILQGCLEKAP